MEVPASSITFTPAQNGLYAYSTQIPNPIRLVTLDGKSKGELTIGNQQLTGLWNPDDQLFSSAPKAPPVLKTSR